MTAQVLTFTGSKKARRETKIDIAARVVPKILGVLGNGKIEILGGLFTKLPKEALIRREVSGFRFEASYHGLLGSDRIAFVSVNRGAQTILEAWLYDKPSYSNTHFGGHIWVRRLDFKRRADWVPPIAALPDAEVSPLEFHEWISETFSRRSY